MQVLKQKQNSLKVYARAMLIALPDLHRSVFRFYSYFIIGGSLFLLSLYLLLPVLRSMGQQNPVMEVYDLQWLGIQLDMNSYWYVPIILLLLSAVILSKSSRAELSIWADATSLYKEKILFLLESGSANQKIHRIAHRAAKDSGLAFRWSCRLALESTKLLVVTCVFILFSAPILLVIFPLACFLGIYFRYSIWSDKSDAGGHGAEDKNADEKLAALIKFRMKRANTSHVFSALMPLTLLILILISKSGISPQFDLADLMFISVLTNTLGTALSSIVQTAIRLRRIGDQVYLVTNAAYQGDYTKLYQNLEELGGKRANKEVDGDEDEFSF